jgi:hypothetical protein
MGSDGRLSPDFYFKRLVIVVQPRLPGGGSFGFRELKRHVEGWQMRIDQSAWWPTVLAFEAVR